MTELPLRPDRAISPARRRLVVGCSALVLILIGWALSAVPLKFDDFDYLTIALLRAGDPLAIVQRIWFAHWRPLNAAVWWALGPLSLDGHWVRVVLVLAWCGAGLLALRRAAGLGWTSVVAVVGGLILCRAWLDVLGWRSWLTTAGTCVALVAALAELHSGRRRAWVILLCGAVGLGFKETGPLLIGLLTVLLPGRARWAGGVVIVAAIAVATFAAGRAGVHHVPGNVPLVLESLSLAAWLMPVALAVRGRWWLGLLAGVVAVLLGVWSAVLVIPGALLLVRERRRDLAWLGAVVVAWCLPLFGHAFSQVYLAEGSVVLALWVAWVVRPPVWSWIGVLPLAVLSVTSLVVDRVRDVEQLRDQQAFIATWEPPLIDDLYVPARTKPDVDTLILLSRGARTVGPPPVNGVPKALSPRSGIWIGAEPKTPGEPLRQRRTQRRGRDRR